MRNAGRQQVAHVGRLPFKGLTFQHECRTVGSCLPAMRQAGLTPPCSTVPPFHPRTRRKKRTGTGAATPRGV